MSSLSVVSGGRRCTLWHHWEWRNLRAIALGNPGCALFFDFVNSDNRLQGNIASLDPRKFVLELFFARIDQYLRPFAEHQFLNLDKAPHVALVDLAGEHLVDLSAIVENDLVDGLRCHGISNEPGTM